MLGTNFVIVVSIQFLWFLAVFWALKPKQSFWYLLLVGLLLGIPYGLGMDLLVGGQNKIFNYYGKEQSWVFLLANWLFSYGFCISTVFVFAYRERPAKRTSKSLFFGLALLLCACAVAWRIAVIDITLLRMVWLGLILILASELVYLAYQKMGYVERLLRLDGKIWSFWLFSILTGVVYEIANFAFPLWAWDNQFPTREINLILIIVFGYCVLLYPIMAMKLIASEMRSTGDDAN